MTEEKKKQFTEYYSKLKIIVAQTVRKCTKGKPREEQVSELAKVLYDFNMELHVSVLFLAKRIGKVNEDCLWIWQKLTANDFCVCFNKATGENITYDALKNMSAEVFDNTIIRLAKAEIKTPIYKFMFYNLLKQVGDEAEKEFKAISVGKTLVTSFLRSIEGVTDKTDIETPIYNTFKKSFDEYEKRNKVYTYYELCKEKFDNLIKEWKSVLSFSMNITKEEEKEQLQAFYDCIALSVFYMTAKRPITDEVISVLKMFQENGVDILKIRKNKSWEDFVNNDFDFVLDHMFLFNEAGRKILSYAKTTAETCTFYDFDFMILDSLEEKVFDFLDSFTLGDGDLSERTELAFFVKRVEDETEKIKTREKTEKLQKCCDEIKKEITELDAILQEKKHLGAVVVPESWRGKEKQALKEIFGFSALELLCSLSSDGVIGNNAVYLVSVYFHTGKDAIFPVLERFTGKKWTEEELKTYKFDKSFVDGMKAKLKAEYVGIEKVFVYLYNRKNMQSHDKTVGYFKSAFKWLKTVDESRAKETLVYQIYDDVSAKCIPVETERNKNPLWKDTFSHYEIMMDSWLRIGRCMTRQYSLAKVVEKDTYLWFIDELFSLSMLKVALKDGKITDEEIYVMKNLPETVNAVSCMFSSFLFGITWEKLQKPMR